MSLTNGLTKDVFAKYCVTRRSYLQTLAKLQAVLIEEINVVKERNLLLARICKIEEEYYRAEVASTSGGSISISKTETIKTQLLEKRKLSKKIAPLLEKSEGISDKINTLLIKRNEESDEMVAFSEKYL